MMTIVLLPGMDGTGVMFAPLVAALGPAVRVQVVSYPTTVPLDYAVLEVLVRAALPTDGPYILLGESFSGPIAVALAATAPPQLRGVILCCTFVRNPRPLCAFLRALIKIVPFAHVPRCILVHLLLGKYVTPALWAMLAQALEAVSPAVLRARLQAVRSVDVALQLKAIKVPVLLLRALHDRVVPRAASRLISLWCPHAKCVALDGPHLLLQVAPVVAARVVLEFVRDASEERDPDGVNSHLNSGRAR
ncbi:MAG: alpha/beta hydrolase [Deltaproteobacteria bacterium]|nr:alpha/beta hydrolase [Deltaproteobacteria bacterium]